MPLLGDPKSSIFFQDHGEGTPILLLHAFPLRSESFRPQWEALSDRFRFIVPDHRGFGRSPPPAGGQLPMERIAQDALRILDHLKIPQAVVGGVSMGGYAAMALLREDPSRVLGLVLASTHPLPDDAAGKERREQTARSVLEEGTTPLAKTMVERTLPPDAPARLKQEIEGMIRSASPEGVAAASRGMAARPDSREILSRYGGPALVIGGDDDRIVPVQTMDQMAGLLGRATRVIIPGTAHLPNQENPAAFNRALLDFLATY